MTKLLLLILVCVVIFHVNAQTGQLAQPGQYKYVAAIFYDGWLVCSGSIIDPNYILTAGHCLFDRIVVAFRVAFGIVTITTQHELHLIQQLFIHPSYSRPYARSNSGQNDIGIAKLQNSLILGDSVQSIPISTSSGPEYRLNCKHVWFRQDETTTPSVVRLRSSNVVVTEQEECQRFYFGFLFENQMCIMNPFKTRNFLPGDSGSPTICGGKLFGVLSDGLNAGFHAPALIFMAAPYLAWISSIAVIENQQTECSQYCVAKR